jgi:NAD(P)-dependent dehydrogenase (short-subunit alcohol dehydrogenase family)
VSDLAKIANKEGGTGVGGKVVTLVLDMQDRVAVGGILGRVKAEGVDKVDILVNNAGECGPRGFVTEADFKSIRRYGLRYREDWRHQGGGHHDHDE